MVEGHTKLYEEVGLLQYIYLASTFRLCRGLPGTFNTPTQARKVCYFPPTFPPSLPPSHPPLKITCYVLQCCNIMFIHTQYTHTSHHSHTGILVSVCNSVVASHSMAGCYSDGTVPLTRAPSDVHHSSHNPHPVRNGMGSH